MLHKQNSVKCFRVIEGETCNNSREPRNNRELLSICPPRDRRLTPFHGNRCYLYLTCHPSTNSYIEIPVCNPVFVSYVLPLSHLYRRRVRVHPWYSIGSLFARPSSYAHPCWEHRSKTRCNIDDGAWWVPLRGSCGSVVVAALQPDCLWRCRTPL